MNCNISFERLISSNSRCRLLTFALKISILRPTWR